MTTVHDVRPKKVKILLDKQRHLLYDMNSFCDIEEQLGSLQVAFTGLEQSSMKAIRVLLWAGLRHEDENLTIRGAGALVGLSNVRILAPVIMEALTGALPQAKN